MVMVCKILQNAYPSFNQTNRNTAEGQIVPRVTEIVPLKQLQTFKPITRSSGAFRIYCQLEETSESDNVKECLLEIHRSTVGLLALTFIPK